VPFVGVAAHELTDRLVSLSDLRLAWLDGAAERGEQTPPVTSAPARREGASTSGGSRQEPPMADADPLLTAARRLEHLLLARLPAVAAPDPVMVEAVRALLSRSPLAIDRLARHLGFSRQYLARRFRDAVGIGPKVLARIARLHRALGVLQPTSRRPSTLAEAALQAGYFDEAHMDRDFRELAGVTPRQAQLAPATIVPVLSLLGS
jgi:AraC-like DNA-binding protein